MQIYTDCMCFAFLHCVFTLPATPSKCADLKSDAHLEIDRWYYPGRAPALSAAVSSLASTELEGAGELRNIFPEVHIEIRDPSLSAALNTEQSSRLFLVDTGYYSFWPSPGFSKYKSDQK